MDSAVETGIEEVPSLGISVEGSVQRGLSVSQDIRGQWGESSQLLFQPGYLQVLKQMALSGQLQMYNIRSVAWRLFLGCLPEDKSKWKESVTASREYYNTLKKKYITDPHLVSASLDVTINNPLSQADNSPWHQFFQDNEMRQMINQDVVRTFPDVAFFKQGYIQETMLDLLFIYCKKNSNLGYRQGMHEILAPILFILHAEEREHEDPSLAPEVQIVMDSDYLEHDAYSIFSELMENMQQWYMGCALEADYFRTQSHFGNSRRMQHDPRTQKPFEEKEFSGTSAIGRKLDKIHHLLLKRADELLYNSVVELSIPAQTYGIRWIRLLFGREFPLPSVLEIWDAVFADGPSLSLIDYISVVMLMHIREVLIEGDYAVCMQHLMRFPNLYEVNYLVQRALHLRNPSAYPSPRIWTYHPSKISRIQAPPSAAITQLLDESFSAGTGTSTSAIKAKAQISTDKISDFFQTRLALKTSSSSSSHVDPSGHGGTQLDFRKSGSRSPSPSRKPNCQDRDVMLIDQHLFSGGSMNSGSTSLGSAGAASSGSGRRVGRFKVIGDRGKDAMKSSSLDREMTSNPKVHPVAGASLSVVERLNTQLEDLEAKCLYCGGKMDSMISILQEEIPNIPDLAIDTENTLLLTIAGLKQIRDLLLKKIPFSGDSTLCWEINTRNLKADVGPGESSCIEAEREEARDDIERKELEEERDVLEPGHNPTTGASCFKADHCCKAQHTDSEENSLSSMGDDWVNLSHSSHPLVLSND